MGDFGIAEGIALISALSAAGSAAYGMSKGTPSAPRQPTSTLTDTTSLNRALLPGVRADAAARTGGGMSPQFIESSLDQQTGVPGGAMGILDEIRQSMNQGA